MAANPPPLLTFSGALAEWDAYLESVYNRYISEIAHGDLRLDNLPIRVRKEPQSHGKDFRFWHLIQEGAREEDRTPDLRRCERISWIAWMIQLAAAGDGAVLRWENERSTTRGLAQNVILWNPDQEYAVILEKRANYFLLTTAYPVQNHRAKRFRVEYEQWTAAQSKGCSPAAQPRT